MNRMQLSVIGAFKAATAAGLKQGFVQQPALQLVKSGNDIAVKVTFNIQDDTGFNTVAVADDAGRIKTFRDVDDFFKQAGAVGLMADAYNVQLQGIELVAPKTFTGDVVKRNQGIVIGFKKRRSDASQRELKLSAEIALMAADGAIPQSLKDEKAAQLASVKKLQSWLNGEIDRINALLGSEAVPD